MLNLTRQERLLIIFFVASFLIGAIILYLKNTGTVDLEVASKRIIEQDNILNVNNASIEELTSLKGIGPTLARRIIAYREKYGPFKEKEDLKKVKGIGPHKFEIIKEKISIE